MRVSTFWTVCPPIFHALSSRSNSGEKYNGGFFAQFAGGTMVMKTTDFFTLVFLVCLLIVLFFQQRANLVSDFSHSPISHELSFSVLRGRFFCKIAIVVTSCASQPGLPFSPGCGGQDCIIVIPDPISITPECSLVTDCPSM